jgi:hypothetical protein
MPIGGEIHIRVGSYRKEVSKVRISFLLCSRKLKDVHREKLYAMMSAEFVALQELPKTADRNPQRTLFLWSVPIDRVYAQLRSAFRQAWVNLQLRLESEMQAVASVIARVRDGTGNETDQAQYHAFTKIHDRLVNAACKITYDMLLFDS